MDKKEIIREAVGEIDLKYIENAVEPYEKKPLRLKLRHVKKGWIAAAAVLFICLVAGGIVTGVTLKNRETGTTVIDEVISTKTVWYDSLEEMEKAANVIVIGKKLNEDHLVYNEADPDHMPLGTVSNFQIDTVLKDPSGVLAAGSVIQVLEQEFYHEALHKRYHVAGYTAMNTDDRYVLHLTYTDSSRTLYCPAGVNFGVASLGEDFRMVDYSGGGGYELIDRIREETREKYMGGRMDP